MANVNKPNTFSANTTISSSAVNDNFDTIYDEFNGNISEANLADSAVTEDKLANSAVATAKIADDAVTAAKIDWASTGANGGIWWEELGRTTLESAGDTITVSSLPARKYLMIIGNIQDTGGTIQLSMRFNGDTGSNYARRTSENGAADTTAVSQASGAFSLTLAAPIEFVANVTNVAAQEKIANIHARTRGTAGAAAAPQRNEGIIKWSNTADQISSVSIINGGGTGDFAIGSELVVLGHN